ncbi:hypothetical protein Tsubulata_038201, partial [Turnera subulata]
EKIQGKIAKTIVVHQNDTRAFPTVQKALDSVPANNSVWIRILVKAGTYNEKVTVEKNKTFIVLQGEGMTKSVIQWGEVAGSATQNATFTLHAENFVAADIGFKNTYNIGYPQRRVLQASAATLYADKASFYRCSFTSVQDTLTDLHNRHYFKDCYIEGATDFIWGQGQSVYQDCLINASRGSFIAAQGRNDSNDSSGFVFLSCSIVGSGSVYLGRAYRTYSRVIYKDTNMTDIIKPEGWLAWKAKGKEKLTTFVEVGCFGPGANTQHRVNWTKQLPPAELKSLTDINIFINQDRWIEQQPNVAQL